LKKRSISIIIGLMSFALIGVVAMQLYFLRQSYHMQSKLFDGSVYEALNNVVAKLSSKDANNFLINRAKHQQIARINKNNVIEVSDKDIPDRQILINDSVKIKKNQSAREHQVALLRDSLQRMILHQKVDDELMGANFQVLVEQYTDEFGDVHLRYTPRVVRNLNPHRKVYKYDTLTYSYADPQFGNQVMTTIRIDPLWKAQQAHKQKQRQMLQVKQMIDADSLQKVQVGKSTVMQSLWEEYQKTDEPLDKRISAISIYIDTLLRQEMHNKGINSRFSYEIATANTDSVIFSNALDTSGARPVFTAADTYQTQIFSKEVINDPGMIKVFFPQKNSLILDKMTTNMSITGGLLIILVFCFGYTLFSIIRQKKISEMKTDFINNMTHEFKTPVSTIMIASEALKDTEMVADKSRIARLASIIYEENERLGNHIERVLNIARIDKSDFKLEEKPIDVNEMISVVVDTMALKLQKCNAELTMDLEAENAVIKADELHFSNVLYNLIDNAIKYSEGPPHITISSLNKNGHVIIKVADKGIGMSRDQQTKIFEQFYRIPTGNVHNVKGFGLGLSYVNTIVKRLNGTINVRSEKDKGSEFELRFQGA
jgi:two-component system phosphate regulon sensor histidine kinase PhoR